MSKRSRNLVFRMILGCLLLAGPAAAQTDQCALSLAITPASPVAFGQPVTVTVSRNFPAQLSVNAPVSLDGQPFCTYTNPLTNPSGNTCPSSGTVFNNLNSGDHTVSWTCTVVSDPNAGPPVSGSQAFTVGPPPPQAGSINPKYVVLSVIYAPPGQASLVDYGASTALGATTAYDHSFTDTHTISTSVQQGFHKLDRSQSWSQTQDTTSSIAVTKTAAADFITPGPASSAQGIDHNNDIILLWINPTVNLSVTSSSTVVWTGYGFDPADPANEVDVVPVYAAWLKDPTKMPAGVAAALARTWALPPEDGSGPGLTQADFNTILLRDPFATGAPAIDPARFVLTGQTFSYAPPPNGGQPATEKLALLYQTIATQTQQTQDEYVETYSISGSVSILKPLFSATMKDEHKIDVISSVSQSAIQTTGQAATLFLTGPNAGYTGPTDLQVYQDTVYGTFLFAFVPETAPGFALAASPASQSVAAGGSASYTVSAAPLNGFGGAVTLSATGGPACGGVTFNPPTIAGSAGTSTMTVPACSAAGNFTLTVNGASGGVTDFLTVRLVVGTPPGVPSSGLNEVGSLRPKFAVLSVVYAPPGKASTVDYSASGLVSATTSIDNSFSSGQTVGVSAGIKASIFKVISIGVSASASREFTQTLDTTKSIEIDKTTTADLVVPGPASSNDGINHDFDVILVWINPVLNFTITGANTAQWTGFSFDDRDPANEVDVIPLYVAWLKNPATMPADVRAALARTWADPNFDGTGPGLTTDDFNTILARDPFSNPAYVPALIPGTTTTTDHRFDLALGKTLAYEPPPAGGQPTTEVAALTYEATQTEGLKATDEFNVEFSVQFSADVTIPITQWLALNLSVSAQASQKLDWKTVVSQTAKLDSTQAAILSLTGPGAGYTGPTDVQVYKDNLYGTFMFGFSPSAPAPDFALWAAPDSQTVPAGGSNTYIVAALAVNGFSGGVTLSASGLPAGVTATFSPNPSTPATPATMTLQAAASTLLGTYTFTVTGTSGALTHGTSVELIVGPPSFVLSGTPAARTVNAGQSTTFSVASKAVAGFSGSIALSASAGTGLTASFSPSSISGTTASTLTVTVASSVAPGTYPVTINGTSGGQTLSETVNVIVTAPPFVLSASPKVHSVLVGEPAVWTVSSTPLGSFNGTVTLSIDVSPLGGSGTPARFGPTTITGAGTSTLTLSTIFGATPTGSYTLTITGTSGTQQATTTVDLLVSNPFTQGGSGCQVGISFNPPQPVAGAAFTLTATLQGLAAGNTGSENISFDHQMLCSSGNSCSAPEGPLAAGRHEVEWTCTSSGPGGSGSGSATQLFAVGTPGTINPKYQVLSVIYAPPGQNSFVDYGTSTTLGTSTSLSNSFSVQTSLGATLTAGLKYTIPKQTDPLFDFKLTAGVTDTFTQTLGHDLSFAVNKSQSTDVVVPGPQDSTIGINHDYDVILLWVNPVANFVITGTSAAQWAGLGFDPKDPVGEMDVVPVYVGWLKNPSLLPPGVAFALARTWADQPTDGSGTALTADDYAGILARDPFATGPAPIDPTRFGLTGETFAYTAPPNGGQPITESLALKYQVTTQQTQAVTDSYQVGFSITSPDLTTTKSWLNGNLKGTLSVSSKASATLTLTNSTQQQNTQVSGQSATLTLAGPPAGYTGPSDLQVYQDNVYGTFLFAFVPATTFQVSSTAPAQTVTPGGRATYPVAATALTGFTGPVVFSASGLPAGATAAFNPASLSATGSTTLTVTTTSSLPIGTYSFTIAGTVTTAGGTETHVAPATLDVVPSTNFVISASPVAQAIAVGQSGSYAVATDAVSSFTGTVTLSASGMPAGVTVSFSPTSITGSGFATLAVNVASTTTPGTYALTVTGTRGSFHATATVSLVVVEAPAQTGSGCSVGLAFDPPAPAAGQPLDIIAAVQGLAAGNTGTLTLSLDHQMLCGGAGSSTCSINQTLTPGLHALEWTCTSSGPGGSGSGSGTATFTAGQPISDGGLNPKYVVLSVLYTPPGQKSTVDYGTSTVLGSATSLSQSFASQLKATVPFNVKIGSDKPVKIPVSVQGIFSQKSEDGASINVQKTTSVDVQVPGLANPADGINHDYDIILLWINPVVNLSITGTASALTPGYAFDSSDPANEIDVVPVYVKWLKDPTTMPQGVKDALARRWAQPPTDGSGPGLTTSDFNTILKRDPFSDPTYVLTVPAGSTTSADSRFDLEAGETFSYEPPPAGGQPAEETFSLQYQTTSTQGQSAIDSYSVSYSKPVSRLIQNYLASQIVRANTLTWTHKFATTTTDVTTQTAKLALVGPCYGYAGPTDVQVFQDNVYGTFMFAFVNGPTAADFSLCASPSLRAIATGASDTYSISASPINGFNGAVGLAVSGLPAGVTASFSATSIPGGAGTVVLTVTVSPAAVAGTYTLQVTGTSGTLAHSVNVTLTVVAPAPVANLSPTGLSFGSQTVGTTSAAQVVTLSNFGTAALAISAIAKTGDFAQTNNCGASLAVGAGCTINVTFTPTASGARTGTLSITDNAAGSPHTLGLNGTGTPPAAPVAGLSPTSLTFSSQTVGTTSAAQVVTLSNTGTAALAISAIAASGDFAQTNNCGTSLAAGASCTINVTFTPTATGARTGTLSVTDNAAGSPQTASLSGTGAAAGPAIVRPTVATADGVAYLNPANAEDGNPATFASGVAGGSMSGEIWSGFANVPGTRSQVNLKITSAAVCSAMNGLELVYSLDGGSTFNTVYLMGFFGGPSGTRPQQTDVIPLSTGQDLSRVQVLALMFGTTGSSHQVYDAWIEVTP